MAQHHDDDGEPMSKADFARLTGKSRSLVSKWIRRRLITEEALVGPEGPRQRIRASIALQQLRDRRDPGQALGNGLRTRLGPGRLDPKERMDPNAGPDPIEGPFASAGLAVDEFAGGATMMAMALVYDVGTLAACLAVGAGASLKVAFALKSAMTMGFVFEVEDILARMDRSPVTEVLYDRTAFSDVDWPKLAAESGEAFELAECEAWLAERFGGGE